MKIVCVTGGTGGHIYPALALLDKFKEQDPSCEICCIGNDDRMEAQLIPEKGYPFQSLHTSGLVGSPLKKMKAILQLFIAYQKSKKILKDFNPDFVIGFGGYVSAPVILAAHHLHIPTLIHEQNSIVGKANQLVMNKVDRIITCYEKCDEVFPKEKTFLLGNPRATTAKESEFDQAYYETFQLDSKKKTILIMMGSLGSSSVNQLMKDALKGIEDNIQFIYVCGKDNLQDAALFKELKNVHVTGYVDTLKIYKKIDGMICRAGATTLAEVTALGIPSILIPSPYVANNHQFYNANVLVEKGAALMIEEKDLNASTLNKSIIELFMDPKKMESVHKQALKLGRPNAAYDIIDLCRHVSNRGKENEYTGKTGCLWPGAM